MKCQNVEYVKVKCMKIMRQGLGGKNFAFVNSCTKGEVVYIM